MYRREGNAYLGMPVMWGRSKRAAMNYIVEKVRERVQSWKKRLLSYAGKEIMIKAVLQALPTYTMSVFRLSNDTLQQLEKQI